MLSECRDALQAVREELKPDQVSPSSALCWVLCVPICAAHLSMRSACKQQGLWLQFTLHSLGHSLVIQWSQLLVSGGTAFPNGASGLKT